MSNTIPTIEASTAQAVMELVQRAARENLPIVDYGRFHAGLGHAPPEARIELRQVAHDDGVIEHFAQDLTVRVAAGARLGDVQRQLAVANQFLPIDGDDDLTIGEIIHHFVYGPMRVGYGSVRDLLMGLRFVDGEGRNNHVGGRTVKNVAGYDLSRFMVGSLGEMGIVYEATLRTYALPEHVMTVELNTDNPNTIAPALSDWLISQAAPAGVSLGRAAERWRVLIHYFGSALSTAAQLRALETTLDEHPALGIIGPSEHTLRDHRAAESHRTAWQRDAAALVKVVVPPARLGELCMSIQEHCRDQINLLYHALPAHGCLFVGGELDADQTRRFDAFLTEHVHAADGLRIWHRRPSDTPDIEPFSPTPPETPMLQRLKAALDPQWRLNPGRLLKRPH